MSTLSVGTIKSNTTSPPVIQNSSNTEVGTFCRAWINFNGTGTISPRADFNVATLTDNGVGDYTITFDTAMPDANYAASGLGGAATLSGSQAGHALRFYNASVVLAGSCRLLNSGYGGGNVDHDVIAVSFFR
jgi:hypothetical protein